MTLGTIAVSLVDIDRLDAVLNVAFSLANTHNSHVLGIYCIPKPHGIALPISYGAISPEIEHSRYFEENRETVKEKFEETARRHNIRAEWVEPEGETGLLADAMLKRAWHADIILASQVNSSTNEAIEPEFVERLILESGRPVLIVPNKGDHQTVGKNVIIGWNATREAVRAAFDAVPLMGDADKVELLWANAQNEADVAGDLPGAELAAVLSRHGIKLEARDVSAPNLPPADVLLNEAADKGADLMVIGAYGHSRLREFVMGGVTRSMLKDMTLPVLMSH